MLGFARSFGALDLAALALDWVYSNKGTRSPTGLRLISDTHDGLPTGLKMACDG